VIDMPLPDANKKSPRVYTNLQNLDLDSVTFANIQATGNPIAVEELNEDEMRRLVLVNLARLVTAGEWTGLLEAGGGAPGLKIVTSTMKGGLYDQFNTADAPPYGASSASQADENPVWVDELFLFPFQAQTTGTITSLGIEFDAAGSFDVAIYGITSENLPDTLIVKGRMTATGAEKVYQTSLTGFGGGAAGSLTVGETYWIGMVQVDGETAPAVKCATYLNRARCASTDEPASSSGSLLRNTDYTKSTGLPDTVTNTNTYPGGGACPKITYEV
jgi:hypothetical protein|tara:strand:- start:228 stop:1049 length:822 start_codon:yes stop_codon:yes gene_type:complete